MNLFNEDGSIHSITKSVEDPKVPANPNCVRGTLKIMGWAFEPLSDRLATKVTYITDIDLGGWIPGYFLKMAAGEIPLVVAAVRKYLDVHKPIGFFFFLPLLGSLSLHKCLIENFPCLSLPCYFWRTHCLDP